MVEHVIRNDGVGGSSPFSGTTPNVAFNNAGLNVAVHERNRNTRYWPLNDPHKRGLQGNARIFAGTTEGPRRGPRDKEKI